MAKYVRQGTDRSLPILPWVMLAVWVCVIWGHSLMPGSQSSSESSFVLGLVQKAGGWLFAQDIPPLQQLLAAHPGIMRVFSDTDLLHHYIRKAGHFSEYFVLGILALNAVRLTFAHPLASAAVFGAIWLAVPNIDETIQRFVPGRAGMTTDVLIDMSGFLCGVLCCLVVLAIAHLLASLFDLLTGGRWS